MIKKHIIYNSHYLDIFRDEVSTLLNSFVLKLFVSLFSAEHGGITWWVACRPVVVAMTQQLFFFAVSMARQPILFLTVLIHSTPTVQGCWVFFLLMLSLTDLWCCCCVVITWWVADCSALLLLLLAWNALAVSRHCTQIFFNCWSFTQIHTFIRYLCEYYSNR